MDIPEDAGQVQAIIDNGLAWQLEGSVGRHAMDYIDAGICMLGRNSFTDHYGNHIPSRFEVEPGTKGSGEYCRVKQEAME